MDLKEFCKRVRMLIGAPVLVATVKGLQVAQSQKKAQQWEHQLSSPVSGAEPGNGSGSGFGAAAATSAGAAPPGASTGGAPSAPPQPGGAPHRPSLAPLEVEAESNPTPDPNPDPDH